ncbi:MAG: PEP-CTERM sorting domain-containing protein [Hyphomicrobiales bacterium]|nr:PEP-CTERM sorting domain-containing protein [Hyphomicrobiales bacterium]
MELLDLSLGYEVTATRCLHSFETSAILESVDSVPVPAALPLFASGLGLLGLAGWRKRRKAAV